MKLFTALVLLGSLTLFAGQDDSAQDDKGDGFKRERKGDTAAAKDALEGKPAPSLNVDGWMNTDEVMGKVNLKQFEGKVVVIDFWGVWCGPCKAAIPHLVELYEKNHDKGLVVIGVHTKNQGEKMAAYVEENSIPYPVCVDTNGETVKAFHVDSYPDYYVIDKKGVLRFADLANAEVDRVIEMLLAEE